MAISLLFLPSAFIKAHDFMNRIFRRIYKKLGGCKRFFTQQAGKGGEFFFGHSFPLQRRKIMQKGGPIFFQAIGNDRKQ